MEEMKMVNVEYQNKNLQKATTNIRKMAGEIRKNLYHISHIIAEVDATKSFEDDGFNNVHEWTQDAFGLKKSASYKFLKIGQEYTLEVQNEKGKIVDYRSVLTDVNAPEDFSTTQIERLMSLGKEKIIELIEDGVIKPSMSVSEIKEIVKNLKYEEADEPEEEESDEPEEEEADEPEEEEADEPEEEEAAEPEEEEAEQTIYSFMKDIELVLSEALNFLGHETYEEFFKQVKIKYFS